MRTNGVTTYNSSCTNSYRIANWSASWSDTKNPCKPHILYGLQGFLISLKFALGTLGGQIFVLVFSKPVCRIFFGPVPLPVPKGNNLRTLFFPDQVHSVDCENAFDDHPLCNYYVRQFRCIDCGGGYQKVVKCMPDQNSPDAAGSNVYGRKRRHQKIY